MSTETKRSERLLVSRVAEQAIASTEAETAGKPSDQQSVPISGVESATVRHSCDECAFSRKRCINTGPPAKCERCARLKFACVYQMPRKRGPPKTKGLPPEASGKKKRGRPRKTPLEPQTKKTAGRPKKAPDQHKELPTAMSQTVDSVATFSNVHPTPSISLWDPTAVVPDDATSNLVFREYLYSLYLMFPPTVRSGLLAELASNSLPDYFVNSLMFWTIWWNKEKSMDGVNDGTVRTGALLQWIFQRVQVTLLPALELTLCGYDTLFGTDDGEADLDGIVSREEYKRNAIYVVMSLLHLLSVATNFRRASDTVPFSDSKLMLNLTVRTARAARLNCGDIYGGGLTYGPDKCPPLLLERARRAWWTLVGMDRHLAIMYDTPAEIKVEECLGMELHISDAQYEHMKQAEKIAGDGLEGAQASPTAGTSGSSGIPSSATAQGTPAPMTPPPAPEAIKPDLDHLYPFSSKSVEMVVKLLANGNNKALGSTASSTRRPVVVNLEPASPDSGRATPPRQLIQHLRLRSSISPSGLFSPTVAYTRLFFLFEQIMIYRRNHARPYADSLERSELLSEMNALYQEFPWKGLDMAVLKKPELGKPGTIVLTQDLKALLGVVGYVLLIFHTAIIMLSMPNERELWSNEICFDWFSSSAYLLSQEHAIRATFVLQQLLEIGARREQFAAPFFQFCVVRTGMVHFKYLCGVETADIGDRGEGFNYLLSQANGQLAIHTAALQAGQFGVLLDGEFTFWYKVWRFLVEERGQVVGSGVADLAASVGFGVVHQEV